MLYIKWTTLGNLDNFRLLYGLLKDEYNPCFTFKSFIGFDMSSEFIPRLGKTVFACRFCGCEPLQWTEIAHEKWMPFDLVKREIHQCWNIKLDILTPDSNVLRNLHAIGFKSFTPRTSSWKYAYIANNATNTIYFLVGQRSIDFKLYDHVRETRVDEKGDLFTDGGIFVRNYYHESDVNIHELILEIASRFVANNPIGESFLSGHGKSMKEVKKELHQKLSLT